MKRVDDADNSYKMAQHLRDRNSEDHKKGRNWRLWIKNLSGVAACLASGFFKGVVPASSRYVGDRGYTSYQILFLNDLLILTVALCVTVYQRPYILPDDWKQGLQLIFQGLTRFTSMLCLFTAYQFIPPANTEAVLNASMPVFVVVLSRIFLQEVPTRVTIIGSMWCVAGVVILSYGSFINMMSSAETTDVTVGIVLTIAGSLTCSMLDVGVKSLLKSTPIVKIATYTYVISTLSTGIGAFLASSTWRIEPGTAGVLALSCLSHGNFILFFYLGATLVEVNAVIAMIQLSAFPSYGLQWAMLGFAPTVLDGLGLSCVLIGAFSIVIWEALARWKEEKHRAVMEQLDLDQLNDD